MRTWLGYVGCLVLIAPAACGDITPPAGDAGPPDADVEQADTMVVNAAPVAVDDAFETLRNQTLDIALDDLLANDTDDDGDVLAVTAVLNAVNGEASLAAGTVEFIPDVDFAGDASFEYEISDGNGGTDTAAVSVTVIPTFVTVAPQVISGGTTCHTRNSNTGRKVAVDAARTIYAAMVCGTEVGISISHDAGTNYTALPTFLTFPTVNEVAIQGGPPGVAYLAVYTGSEVYFSRTADAGLTWSTPIILGTANGTSVSIATSGDLVLVNAYDNNAGALAVWRNATQGEGDFTTATSVLPAAFFDVVIDETTGYVWLAADTPDYHLARSIDGGLTFEPEIMPAPAGTAFYSDWATGAGVLFGSGTSPTSLSAITLDTMVSTPVTGLAPSGNPQGTAVAAAPDGTVYLVVETDAQTVQLQRASPGATAMEDTMELAINAVSPSVVTHPDNGVIVSYTVGNDVWITVQSF